MDYLNVQDQPKFTWPATFSLAGAYTDQLERSGGLSAARIGAVRSALQSAQQATGAVRRTDLTKLASSLDADARASSDAAKVRLLASAVRGLAK